MGKKAQLNVAQELFLGAEAALISRFFTTPVSNVTTRLQTAGKDDKKGFVETMHDIHREKGITGFWSGIYILVLSKDGYLHQLTILSFYS